MSDSEDFDWIYYELELVPDRDFAEQVIDLEVDEVSWRSFFLKALQKLHGVFGASITTDIIEINKRRAIVRVQKEDGLTFKSSIVGFITDLSIFGFPNIRSSISIKEATKDTKLV